MFKLEDMKKLSIMHASLNMRLTILSQPSYKGMVVTEESTIDCVPASISMFLGLLLGGQQLIDADPDEWNNQVRGLEF